MKCSMHTTERWLVQALTYKRRERNWHRSQEPRWNCSTPNILRGCFISRGEEYQHTACCLPRREVAHGDDTGQEEFLERISSDKNSLFPISFVMDGIESLCERSDEWLIDLNNDARFLRLCVIIRAVCVQMSNEELAEVLKFLARAQVRTRNNVLPALYEECCNRVGTLSQRNNLLLLDCWRMIGYPVPPVQWKVIQSLPGEHIHHDYPRSCSANLLDWRKSQCARGGRKGAG